MRPGESFHTFGFQHLAALAVLAGLGIALVTWCRRLGPAGRACLSRGLAAFLLAYVVTSYGRRAWLGTLRWDDSLPLHLCNLVMLACVITLLRPNALGFEIAYFWGFSGTFLALITPDLHEGFPSWKFVQFFWGHGGSLLAILFMIAGLGMRPRANSILRMFVAINLYAALVAGLNGLFHWNYGYMCAKPIGRSPMDFFGDWPWYILGLEAIALASFVLLDLPWLPSRRAGNRVSTSPRSDPSAHQ